MDESGNDVQDLHWTSELKSKQGKISYYKYMLRLYVCSNKRFIPANRAASRHCDRRIGRLYRLVLGIPFHWNESLIPVMMPLFQVTIISNNWERVKKRTRFIRETSADFSLWYMFKHQVAICLETEDVSSLCRFVCTRISIPLWIAEAVNSFSSGH